MNWIKNRWLKIPAEPKKVRDFGLILSGLLVLFGFIAFFRGHRHYFFEWPLGGAILLITLAFPPILILIYRTWMLLAQGISWVLLRVILGTLFYLVISPIAIVMRLRGADLLDEAIDHDAKSYWNKRPEPPLRERYEKLY